MNKQLENLKLQSRILNWKLNKVIREEKENRKKLNTSLKDMDGV